MTTRKWKMGIVGAGAIVRDRHLPNLRLLPDVEVVAIANSTFESSERFCREHLPGAKPLASWQELVAMPELDIIWIGTTPHLHCEVTLAALEAKRHLFCQARMAMDLAEAEQMLAASLRHPELVTMLCPPPHGMRGDATMRRLLAEELIGRPHRMRLRSLSDIYLDPNRPAHWRQRRELSGRNVMTLGIYVEVLQRWLGPIQIVYAEGQILTTHREGYRVEIPDALSVVCTFESGIKGTLEFSGISSSHEGDRLEIDGAGGTLTYDFASDEIGVVRKGSPRREILSILREEAGEWHVERDFIEAVRQPDRPRPHPTFEEGVAYMRVVQAVADSMEKKAPVAIDPQRGARP
ncbi:MAG: Gfo/Idh/MocA family oxidoreductase [Verrucomicrobiia bacterium]